MYVFVVFKKKTADEKLKCLVGSEMCKRDKILIHTRMTVGRSPMGLLHPTGFGSSTSMTVRMSSGHWPCSSAAIRMWQSAKIASSDNLSRARGCNMSLIHI